MIANTHRATLSCLAFDPAAPGNPGLWTVINADGGQQLSGPLSLTEAEALADRLNREPWLPGPGSTAMFLFRFALRHRSTLIKFGLFLGALYGFNWLLGSNPNLGVIAAIVLGVGFLLFLSVKIGGGSGDARANDNDLLQRRNRDRFRE